MESVLKLHCHCFIYQWLNINNVRKHLRGLVKEAGYLNFTQRKEYYLKLFCWLKNMKKIVKYKEGNISVSIDLLKNNAEFRELFLTIVNSSYDLSVD